MSMLFSKGQTLRQNLPSFLDGRKVNWPNPEQSTGRQCVTINGLQCWQAIGPALEIMEKLSSPIKELLDKHQEVLEQGESKPRAISFNMWMVGPITSASPAIVISSRNRRQRSYAKTLLKESKLLDDYPGVKIKTMDRVPAIYRAGEPISEVVDVNISEPGIYVIDGSRGLCGALISYGQSRFATMGGSMLINDIHYGFSAGHARFEPTLGHDDDIDMDDAPCFDDDSDSESNDIPEITSKGSVSPTSDRGAHTDSSESTFSAYLPDSKERTQMDIFPRTNTQTATSSEPVHYLQVHQLPESSAAFIDGDLDYELLALSQSRTPSPNVIPLPGIQSKVPTYLTAKNVVRQLVESTVYAATGTTGCVKGTILKSKHYIKMECSKRFQEMWVVKLERKTIRGDCGSWVVDATTGDIYGHIIAGDSLLDIAFIIPAYKVWDDIQRRFGTMPLLSTKQSLASYDSSRDSTKTWRVVSRASDLFSNYSVNSTAPTISTRTASTPRLLPEYESQGYGQPYKIVDTSGQVAPLGVEPRVTATLWEEKGCLCFQVVAKGVTVARRDDNNMINGTKLLDVAGMTRGRRDGILKSQKTGQLVKSGPMHLTGVWIPFERALDFANAENITKALYPLFVHNIGALLYHPDNRGRTSEVMTAPTRQRLDTSKQQDYAPGSTSLLDAAFPLPSFDGIYSPSPLPKTSATNVDGLRKQESTSSAQGSNQDDDRARKRPTSFKCIQTILAEDSLTSESNTETREQDPWSAWNRVHKTTTGPIERPQSTIQMMVGPPLSPGASPGHRPRQHYQRYNYPQVNPANQDPPCNTLYVGNLPIDTSQDELKAIFSKQRGYKRLCFRTKQNGSMCFVEFEDVSFATKALNELYGYPLRNSVEEGLRLSFSKNPLGIRTSQPGGIGPPGLSPSRPRLDTNGRDIILGLPPSVYKSSSLFEQYEWQERHEELDKNRRWIGHDLGGIRSPKEGVTTGVGGPRPYPITCSPSKGLCHDLGGEL